MSMRHTVAGIILSLSGAVAAQEAGDAVAGQGGAGGPEESGSAEALPSDAAALLQRFDADGNASLELSELEALHKAYFSEPSGPVNEAEAAAQVAQFLREHEDRALGDLAREQPGGLLHALIIDPKGMELGRIVRLAIDREEGAYHAVIPAGKLVELVGIKFMVIPLARLRIREDVLLLDDADAVQAFQEDRYRALEAPLANRSAG